MAAEIARPTEASMLELGPLPKTMGIGPIRMRPPLEVEPPAPRTAPTMTTRNPAKMMSMPSEARFVEFMANEHPREQDEVISTIVRTIAMLAHFASDPNMMG